MTAKRILITGGRSPQALDLGRKLRAVGHEVFVLDTTRRYLCKYSNAFTASFTVASPRFNQQQFRQDVLALVEKHHIEFILPTFEEIFYLAQFLEDFPDYCQVFSVSFAELIRLHNKYEFNQLVAGLGLPAAKSMLIHCQQDLIDLNWDHDFIIKKVYSRAAQNYSRHKVGSPLPQLQFYQKNPWMVQAWVEGKQYCSYSICQQGKVLAHSAYPVQFSIDGNSCVFFESIRHAGILNWLQTFAAKTQFTGQVAFDFIETKQDELFVIECNPRTTSGVYLFSDSSGFDKALLNETTHLILPEENTVCQLGMGMLIYGWRTPEHLRGGRSYLKTFLTTRDVVFRASDIKPSLMQPFSALGYLSLKRKLRLSLPAAFNYDLEWNGETYQTVKAAESVA